MTYREEWTRTANTLTDRVMQKMMREVELTLSGFEISLRDLESRRLAGQDTKYASDFTVACVLELALRLRFEVNRANEIVNKYCEEYPDMRPICDDVIRSWPGPCEAVRALRRDGGGR